MLAIRSSQISTDQSNEIFLVKQIRRLLGVFPAKEWSQNKQSNCLDLGQKEGLSQLEWSKGHFDKRASQDSVEWDLDALIPIQH